MISIAGATGYVGGLLARRLLDEGEEVRALARRPEAASELGSAGAEVIEADVLRPDTLGPALEGADVAYYLVHSMGRGSNQDFARHDREGARNFADAARSAGVRRIVFLGGLGSGTAHLDSRNQTAEDLGASGVPVAWFRAAAIIGSASDSFLIAYHLARKLPVMVTPRWSSTRTQPIAVGDVVAYLAAAADLGLDIDRELQLGGPEVTTYEAMIDLVAAALGRRSPPRVGVPFLTPSISAAGISLLTPVDPGIVRPLIDGLAVETVVTDPSGMSLFPAIRPTPLMDAVRAAVAELAD